MTEGGVAMRVMTYNIYNGGRDDRDLSRLDRVFEVIEAQAPQILILNECALFELDGGAACYALERRLGLRSVLVRAHSGYHLAAFVPASSLRAAREEHAGFHHAALRLSLELAGMRLQLIGCHLSPFSAQARLIEAQQLCGYARAGEPLLLLGDLNALSPADVAHMQPERWPARYQARHAAEGGSLDLRAIAALERAGLVDVLARFHPGRFIPTRPTALVASGDRPSQRLDYIFASQELAARATAARVVDDEGAQHASDHLPVVVDFTGWEKNP